MQIRDWLNRLAPDLTETLKRFPLASIFVVLVTITVLAVINEFADSSDETWLRLALGLATASVFAAAGVLFREAAGARVVGIVFAYIVPFLAVGAFFVRDMQWLTPWALPVVSILWLSVAGFTERGHGELRRIAEDRFWWFNHQAAITAIIAAVAMLLIALGIVAIERSLSTLFGLETSDLFYQWVLPLLGFLFTPLYWLSTVPRFSRFDRKALVDPDFLARATGFLGQFVLTPLLLAYAMILLAYTVQIVVTRTLPQGMLGWMVLGFVTTGAATWLLLHPTFMRERMLVRFFRRTWFWLTVIPLALYAVAVWIRIDTYGLTGERMILIAGGTWAALLTILYLLGRGDIRLIPGLAAGVLLLFSVGPWNFENLPRVQQGAVLDALIIKGGVTSLDTKPDWTSAEAQRATGAMTYLFGSDQGRADVVRILAAHGIPYDPGERSLSSLFDDLGAMDDVDSGTSPFSITRKYGVSVDVSATPYFGRLSAFASSGTDVAQLGLTFVAKTDALEITSTAGSSVTVDLGPWLARNPGSRELDDPLIAFAIDGISYRLVVDMATLVPLAGEGRTLNYLEGTLFADKAVPVRSTP